jgi:hypothetical protein
VKPYRRRLIGLPLQRSLFSGISRAPATIGLLGVLPDDRLAAWLDDEGNLYLDTTDVERLTAALAAQTTPAFFEAMEMGLATACEAVIAATERSRSRATSADEAEARALLSRVGEAVATLLPYGILSKFVPDALYQLLQATGDSDAPPFPTRSPGTELTLAAASLCLSCDARGYSPERLRTEWPLVPSDVAAMVRDFCRDHAGFGPLACEAPGYEDPRYVIGILEGMLADDDPAALLRRLGPSARIPPVEIPSTAPLRRLLAAWLTFLERETWYVRRAFYLALLPSLRRLLPAYQRTEPEFVPEDLLFLTLDELIAPLAEPRVAATRRVRFLADAEYFAKYGITADRLRAIMVQR